jgi:predicted dehydrogenase
MNQKQMNRRAFLGKSATVGVAAAIATSRTPPILGANERVRMGIIGSGGMGRNHMNRFKSQGVEWIAVCDVYDVNLQKGLEIAGAGAKSYSDYRRFLENKEIDAVLIASPEHWHHDHLIATVRAGKDAYCEKPMSWSIEQGADMVREVQKTDRIVQVGMQRRSSPLVLEAKALIDEGLIGEINMVRAEWYWNVNINTDPNLPGRLDWEAFQGPAPKKPFEAVHPSETPDTFCAIFEYPKFTCTWTLAYMNTFMKGWGIVFQGQKGTLEMCEDGYRVFAEPWSERSYDRWKVPAAIKQNLAGGATDIGPHEKNFLECLKSRKQPNATVEIGHKSVRTLHLANIAHHNRCRAELGSDGQSVRVGA